MNPNHLRVDEIDYELSIRGICGISEDIQKVATLREILINEENKLATAPRTTERDVKQEVRVCHGKLTELEPMVRVACGGVVDMFMLGHYRSRIIHLAHRVKRLVVNEPYLGRIISTMREQVDGLLGKIDMALFLKDEETNAWKFKCENRANITLSSGVVISNDVEEGSSCSEFNNRTDAFQEVEDMNCAASRQGDYSFSGEVGSDVNGFIEEIESLIGLGNFSSNEIIDAIPQWLSGDASRWYNNNCHNIRTWAEFKIASRLEFLPPDYQENLLRQMNTTTQKCDESINSFVNSMEILFDRLAIPLSDEYKIYVIRKGIHSSFRMTMMFVEMKNFEELKELCARIDGMKLLMERNNLGMVDENKNVQLDRDKMPNIENTSSRKFGESCSTTRNRADKMVKREGQTTFGLQEVKEKETLTECWNCGKVGHGFRKCSNIQMSKFCYKCGAKSTTILNCKACNINKCIKKILPS